MITAPDEADLAIVVSASDVRNRVGGADYDPSPSADATLDLLIRLTDTDSGTGATPATTSDFHFLVPLACTATADPALGSSCAANTSADAITPGAIKEGKRTVMTTSRFWLFDSGLNATRGDSDDRQFAQSGIYVP